VRPDRGRYEAPHDADRHVAMTRATPALGTELIAVVLLMAMVKRRAWF
jgi:hypothetical protein